MVRLDSIQEQIKDIEEEIKKTQYNKATQHHIGLLKAKLARLRDKQEQRGTKKGKSEGYSVKKSGDATVILVGFPSVGKSTLLTKLTNAESKTAGYAFTTLTVIPGVMEYQHAKIQILDVPGILKGAAAGTGRGKEVLSVVRNCDLVIFILDVINPEEQYEVLKKELYNFHIRVNSRKPDVKIVKKAKDGLSISSTVKMTRMDKKTVESILKEFKITNADVVIRDDITPDELIDCIEGNKHYVPAITLLNKTDNATREVVNLLTRKLKAMPISAKNGIGIDDVKEKIFRTLSFIRIFMKEVGKPADLDVPLIVKEPATIRTVCQSIHKDFVRKFRYAKVWGKSAKFPGQKKSLHHSVQDGDIVEIHLS